MRLRRRGYNGSPTPTRVPSPVSLHDCQCHCNLHLQTISMEETMITLKMTKNELEELKTFSGNVKLVLNEYNKMVRRIPDYETLVEDCEFRFGDMTALCDEVVGVCNAELKKEN